ncbi:ABC transporter permease subunit [Paenibacillus lycopersici]|uniref:ABC transporter permease subunit n=1 Tax=Paenibacillus lycopersici TaxID=2704462 RepID=A0A6C0FXI6_9BACL|nr:ABC transporter permease subunit [Paenibacillus lycopersici]QHT61417.1 ABC transporter permease subunit [Paenibacillus lycopersici]
MPKLARHALVLPALVACVLLFALFPALLHAGPAGSGFSLRWSDGLASVREYFAGYANGSSFRYLSGKTELGFWREIGSSAAVTLFYTALGALAGMTLGVSLGICFAVSRRAGWLRSLIALTGFMPDFVIVLLLQLSIVYIASETGFVVFQVASFTSDDPAVALPLLTAILIPANYMIRNVSLQMKQTLTEDYIGFAKARGLGKTYVVFFHALPNVLPYIKADLHKYMGILFGNLFIFEYLYNLHGVTMLVFSNAFAYEGYQYGLVVNGLLTLLAIYAVVYALLRVMLYGWEKVFVR